MPVVAVAAAAASFTAGMAAVTAGSALIGGAMMVGGALTAIGTVTGNAKLAKIGGILSIAGGVANLASNAINAASSTASTIGEGVAEGMAASGVEAVGYEGAVAAAESGLAGAEGAITEGVNLGGTEQFALDGASKTMPVSSGDSAKGLLYQDKAAATIAPTTAPDMPTGAESINAMDTGAAKAQAAATQTDAFNAADVIQKGVAEANGGGGLMDTMGGKLKEFQAWSKQNPELAKMLTEGVKGVAGNLVTSPKDQAMIDYYNANADKIKRNTLWSQGRMA